MKEYIKNQLLESAGVKMNLAAQFTETIAEITKACIESLKGGGKIMFCGNGGSAADSQHLATELVVRLSSKLNRPALPAIALTTDTSLITACSNDFSFNEIFARQVEALANSGDVLIAISTSGNSPNVIKAVAMARAEGVVTIGLAGGDGGKLKDDVDQILIVPSNDVQRIQESHITIGHIVIGLIERELYPNE
jgi:D-sedoheptulose 7-phosphate isomerase